MIKENSSFSIIIPVKNEAVLLERCLESLMKLDYPKECFEIIIADGRSTDDTKKVARHYGAKVVDNEKRIVVSGRNQGYKEAKGEVVAFTDADCIFDSGWLRNSIKYFADDNVGGVGGVTFAPPDSSHFEKAIDFLFRLAEFFQTTAHRKDVSSVKEVKDIPGCNALYRREALSALMPVDESLLTAEDVWMNFCVRKSGYKLIQAPNVILWHYRRNSPEKFARQMYRFAIGRLQVGKKSFKLLNIFHIICGFGIPLSLLTGILFYLSGVFVLFLKLIVVFFAGIALLALVQKRSIRAAINAPLVMIIFIAFWSIGFLRELFFPLRNVKGK